VRGTGKDNFDGGCGNDRMVDQAPAAPESMAGWNWGSAEITPNGAPGSKCSVDWSGKSWSWGSLDSWRKKCGITGWKW
jgi:hypothetical protein